MKRDTAAAPAAETNSLDSMGKDILSLAEKLKDQLSKSVDVDKIKDGLAKTFDPDKIKSDFNALVDQINEAVSYFFLLERPSRVYIKCGDTPTSSAALKIRFIGSIRLQCFLSHL